LWQPVLRTDAAFGAELDRSIERGFDFLNHKIEKSNFAFCGSTPVFHSESEFHISVSSSPILIGVKINAGRRVANPKALSVPLAP
jgi:hypothetical protein